jgi:hypothetical protein
MDFVGIKENTMRKWLGFLMVVVWSCSLLSALPAQQKAVNFKKLQEYLPKIDLPGYAKGKPGGESSTVMGMSTSEATLSYTQSASDNPASIEVKISDMAGVPYGTLGASLMGATEYENQTETGYEKSIKIQGYPGTESVENSEDSKTTRITLVVGGRFMVELSGEGTSDVSLLRKLIDSMNLGELAKVTQ